MSISIKGWDSMALLVVLAILSILFFGLGFTINWLFVLAVVAALLFVISLFLGSARRTYW